MQLRLGLIIGMAIGYVLGAKAGRARYEQIAQLWGEVRKSEPAQQITEDVKAAAGRAGETLNEKTGGGVAKVTEIVRGQERRRA